MQTGSVAGLPSHAARVRFPIPAPIYRQFLGRGTGLQSLKGGFDSYTVCQLGRGTMERTYEPRAYEAGYEQGFKDARDKYDQDEVYQLNRKAVQESIKCSRAKDKERRKRAMDL